MMKTRASPGSHERTKENLCCSEKTSLEPGLGVRGLNVRGKLEESSRQKEQHVHTKAAQKRFAFMEKWNGRSGKIGWVCDT